MGKIQYSDIVVNSKTHAIVYNLRLIHLGKLLIHLSNPKAKGKRVSLRFIDMDRFSINIDMSLKTWNQINPWSDYQLHFDLDIS